MWSLALLASSGAQAQIVHFNEPQRIVNYVDRIIEPTPAPQIRYVDRFVTVRPTTRPTPAPTYPPYTPPPPNCRWLMWGAWNECSSVCGKPRQSRIRRCDGGTPGIGGCCPGSDCTHKPCQNPIGDDVCAYWSGWSEWGSCSTTCGPGSRRKNRQCIGQDIINGNDCVGDPFIEESCYIGDGNWLNWQSWSSCSATCGDAIRTRERAQSCSAPNDLESESCNLLACCDELEWSQWSQCSATCFTGTRTRSHGWTCDYKAPVVITERCDAGAGVYSLWSNWNSCSQTCTGGTQGRFREHSCGLRDVRGYAYELAQTQACGDDGWWAEWSDNSSCSSSCTGGITTRSRAHQCSRQVDRESSSCGSVGTWREWSNWSSCSSSCFGGTQSRRRGHHCSAEVDVDQRACGEVGDWMIWSAWSGCSKTCFGGERSRTRFHSCGAQALLADPTITSARQTTTELCGSAGDFGLWSRWTGCSVSCGGGVTSRNRYHQCEGTVDTEDAVCNDSCCPEWRNWSQWSDCSVTCGRGIQNRNRDNVCASVNDQAQTRTCYATLPDYPYNQWAQWSSCSKSCRGGFRSRSAEHICDAADVVDTETCGASGFWMEWNNWSGCSVTCGIGQKTRTRRDSCGDSHPEIDTASCDAGPGDFSNWSLWGACNQTCPGGVSRRFQQHNCGAEPLVDVRDCGEERWGLWTTWSGCSQSCLGGVQTRTKTEFCSNEVVQESRDCGSPGSYLSWSPWTRCNQECQGGLSTRQRAHTCELGTDHQQRECGRPGYYSQWSFWTDCLRDGVHVSCDGGKRTRSRDGYCGFDNEVQDQDCNMAECCDNTPWTTWGQCSVSCGNGHEARFIQDCHGRNVQTERRTCYNPVAFLEWTHWSACSASCGAGIKKRTRSGPCTGVEEETVRCDNGGCPYWELWTPWSPCDATCGEGARTRTRACRNGVAGVDCVGDAFEAIMCMAVDPGFTNWAEWTACSASCDYGFKSRDRSRICGGEVDSETVRCLVDPGQWSLWSSWAGCSASCGGGETNRQRIHSCSGESQVQEMTCNTDTGYYVQWGQWSACSRTCNGGTRFRSRQHTCGLADQVQEVVCGSHGTYGHWSDWSSCPRCYDSGEEPVLAVRQRGHSCSESGERQEKTCLAGRCPYWSGWGSWGSCSTTCGMGYRERVRRCQGDETGCVSLHGERRETMSCEAGNGLDYFGQWSPCSTTCGTGVQIRSVQNTCSNINQEESRSCTSNLGVYGEWSHWGSCSSSCGGGLQTRSRSHSCGVDDYVQERSCNIHSSGNYGQWSAWSGCPVSCGGGTITRSRYHTCSGEAESQSTTCNQQPCSYYGVWSNWAACSVSCGLGTKSRTRYCIGGSVGSGLCAADDVTTVDTIQCDMGDCCNYLWSTWTGCCEQSGRNVRLRFKGGCTGADHQQEDKPCGTVGVYVDTCYKIILSYQQQGFLSYSYNTTGYTTYSTGGDITTTTSSYIVFYTMDNQRIEIRGQYEMFNGVRTFVTNDHSYFGVILRDGAFDMFGRFISTVTSDIIKTAHHVNTDTITYTYANFITEAGEQVQVRGSYQGSTFVTSEVDYFGARFADGSFDMSGRFIHYNNVQLIKDRTSEW